MDQTPDCAGVAPLLAELAAGAVTGYERAQALRHVEGCPACRRELGELSRAADDLLLLAPWREPPAGFESAVMQRLDPVAPAGRSARRWRRPALQLAAAATALVVAVGAGVAVQAWRDAPDRRLADRYRNVLAQPTGSAPRAAPVTTDAGSVVGQLYLYQGSPPWVMVALTAAPESGNYTMDVVTVDGVRYAVGTCTVTGGTGTIGYSLRVPLSRIATIELIRPGLRLSVHPG